MRRRHDTPAAAFAGGREVYGLPEKGENQAFMQTRQVETRKVLGEGTDTAVEKKEESYKSDTEEGGGTDRKRLVEVSKPRPMPNTRESGSWSYEQEIGRAHV